MKLVTRVSDSSGNAGNAKHPPRINAQSRLRRFSISPTLMSSSTQSRNNAKPYVREATLEEIRTLDELFLLAFLDDPAFYYFWSIQSSLSHDSPTTQQGRENIKHLCRFMVDTVQLLGGRIMVAVVPKPEGSISEDADVSDCEVIGASALWLPPHQRISWWTIVTLVRAGFIQLLLAMGLEGYKRMAVEYKEVTARSFESGLSVRNVRETPDESWYLQLIGTHPAHQGKGLMSLLVREAFAHSPTSVFLLDSTTPNSMVRYAHLGFEMMEEVRLGKGVVGSDGLPASGEEATGVPLFCMVKAQKQE
ncbi:hypothetical protein HGRIS_006941 [Hohenbuehelia grisea]|uniref:N-acetyltransferase domain-containing protein n=1 Tax=Hohenbuehelia grisea TaxID=104357 RepID=A0ABR3JC56_9AGAR